MATSTPSVTRGITATVANGGTLGTALDLGIFDYSRAIVGIVIKGTILSTTMTFNVSPENDGVTFYPLFNEAGSQVQLTISSNQATGIKQDLRAQMGSWRFIQPVMGSTETNGATIIFDIQ